MNPYSIRKLLGAHKQSAPPFTPPSISGNVLWLDGADTSPTNIQNVSGAVTQWSDKSGLGNHATQSVTAQRPITGTRTVNGRNSIDFNGTNHGLALPSGLYNITNSANTLIVVSQSDNLSAAIQRMISGANSGSFLRYGLSSTGTVFRGNHNPASLMLSVTVTRDTLPHIGMMTRSGTSMVVRQDGSSISGTNGADLTLVHLLIGNNINYNSESFDGLISEIIIYNRLLNNTEITTVFDYLKTKWGTP